MKRWEVTRTFVKHVPSVETCKKLKEMGFPQTRYGLWWIKIRNENGIERWELAVYDSEETRLWRKNLDYVWRGGCFCCTTEYPIIEAVKAPLITEVLEWKGKKVNVTEEVKRITMETVEK